MLDLQIYKEKKLKIKHIKTSAAASYKVYKVTEAATKIVILR